MICMLGGMMLAGLSACSGDDDATDVPDDGVKVRRLTITQTEEATARTLVGHASQRASAETDTGADATLGSVAHYFTRATLVEDNGLTASWTAGNGLTYCILNRINDTYDSETGFHVYKPISGPLEAASTAVSSQFTGDVECNKGDYLAVVYPATEFTRNDSYTIRLTGQDGTLSTLATNYHYVFGKATVTEVTETTANATMGKMKSLLTVCKFSFKDKSTKAVIPISTLEISYSTGDSNNGKYPQSATVAIGVNTAQADVHASGVAGDGPLLVDCSNAFSSPSLGLEAVYVALLPTAAQCAFNFTVTNANGTYTGKANATLNEGEYVVATGLKLTKQQATKE